jgi:hypothetical protein
MQKEEAVRRVHDLEALIEKLIALHKSHGALAVVQHLEDDYLALKNQSPKH